MPDHLQGKSLVPKLKEENVTDDLVFIQSNLDQDHLKGTNKDTQLANDEMIKKVGSLHTRTIISQNGWQLSLSTDDES